MDLTVVAYATLALSLFVSAIKMGGWILNADPRTIVNSGRWAVVALAALALGVLLWLVVNGRWTFAMMLAAFMLPVFVQAAPRWRVLFGPLNATSGGFASAADLGAGIVPGGFSTARTPVDPELVRQSIAVLRAYLEQTGARIEHRPADSQVAGRPAKASRQRTPAHVDAGGARRPRARAHLERAGDQGGASPPRAMPRSGSRRHPLPDHQDQRGQGRSPRRIGCIRRGERDGATSSLAADPVGRAERRPPPIAGDLSRRGRDARGRHRLRQLRRRLGAARGYRPELLAHGRRPRRASRARRW